MKIPNKQVFVAMSGGVDSSVAAGLLKEAGYAVTGVTMSFTAKEGSSLKCGAQNIKDAEQAAKILGIPHHVLDFSQQMDEQVVEEFAREYLQGRTPNPCVQCNQMIKFGALFERVRELGADFLATGHYAKIVCDKTTGGYELQKGADEKKDQSYFLYRIRQDMLPHILFPLGNFTKEEVRAMAERFRLNTAQKEESQDICFVPDTGYKAFIRERVGDAAFRPGPFKNHEGEEVGEHQGLANYTIGQRDKLGIALGYPAYVYRIDAQENTVYVGPKECLSAKGLVAVRANMISPVNAEEPLEVRVRIRYNAPEVESILTVQADQSVQVDFREPQDSVTPGQSVVFYRDQVVLGGGIIDRPLQAYSENPSA